MTWLAYSHLGVAKKVTLTTQPSGAIAGEPFTTQPAGKLVDGSGVLSRTSGTTITASKVSGTGTLSGTLTQDTVDGLFAFTDLEMDTITAAVTLGFAAPGLTSATSNSFNVTTNNKIIGMAQGTYTLTGTAVTFAHTHAVVVDPATFTVTGTAVTLRNNKLAAAAGSYTVTGTAATLTYSGDSIPSEAPAWVNSGNLITEFGFDVAAGSPPTSPWTSNAKWQLAVPTTGYYTHRTQVDDGTAPHSPGEFSRIWYEAGMTADASGIPGLVYYAGATYAKVFQTIWFRYNTTFQWHAYGASKICYAPANYTDTLANWAILAMDDRGGGNAFSIGIVDNVLGQSGSDTLSALHRTTVVTVQRGDWVRLSIESIGSTDGAYNGSVNLWVNGVSQGEGAIAIRHSNAAGLANINGFHLGGYWGGGGGVPKAADDYLDLDHAVMYGGS